MKAEELRIGNLVSYEDEIVSIIEISGWIDDPCVMFVPRVLGIESVVIGAIDPIPITEQWLKGFAWQLVKNGFFYIDSYFNVDKEGRLYYRSDYTGVNVDYIHQLQNLYYALTRTELEKK